MAEALQAGHSVVALGDINDFDGQIVDASNNVPISSVLSILKNPLPSTPGDGTKAKRERKERVKKREKE
jgi:hypothetical protein